MCLANSNKKIFLLYATFSLFSRCFSICTKEKFCWWSNQFVRILRSSLSSCITRSINLLYTKITSSIENYLFFSLFFYCFDLYSNHSTIVHVTQKQLSNIASLHVSSAYKSFLFLQSCSQEKLIDDDDDVKSDIINSIRFPAQMSLQRVEKELTKTEILKCCFYLHVTLKIKRQI